jgi:hypothetical protein
VLKTGLQRTLELEQKTRMQLKVQMESVWMRDMVQISTHDDSAKLGAALLMTVEAGFLLMWK